MSEKTFINKLIKKKLINNETDLKREAKNNIKGFVNRHNILTYEHLLNKYDRGKYTYRVFLNCFVYNSQTDMSYSETEQFLIKSNLSADEIRSNREMLKEIAKIHYAKKEYPDFIDLSRNPRISVQKVDGSAYIQDIRFQSLQQLRLSTPYIKRPNQCIDGWGDEQDLKYLNECVPIFIIQNYHKLVDRKLIKPELLTADYIKKYFSERGGYTLPNLKEYVTH